MSDFTGLVQRYIAIWNETDPVARRAAVDTLWAVDGRYVDPMSDAQGRAGFDATVEAVQKQFPGWVFRLGGEVDAHHDQARFTWELGPEGEEAVIVGFDVVVRDADGRVELVLGFLDKVPAA